MISPTVILGISIALQFIAAAMALRLIWITGRWRAWVFISIALLLMGVRRAITFYDILNGDLTASINLTAELAALGISVLMVLGVFFIGPVFERMHRTETDLRENQERFREFAESASDWLWETDPEGRINWSSDSKGVKAGYTFAQFSGLTREEVAGDLMTDKDWLPYRQALQEHTDIKDFECRYPGEAGVIHYALINGRARFDAAGAYLGHRGTASDITRGKHAEKALQSALVDAERANTAKSEFLATMSHEFRTPLNAILGFSEMLRAQYFGPLGSDNYREYAHDIYTSGAHMLSLINDILDISAIEAGKRALVKEAINVDDMLKICIKGVEKMADDGGIKLSLDVPHGVPLLYADKRSAIQIVQNLLSNAVKFTDRGGDVTVSAVPGDQKLMIKVQDTGAGIPPDKLQDITDPFFQTHSDPHIAQQGTGLGLAIVKSLVEAHDGELAFESETGKGTSVTVTFPSDERMDDQSLL
ncbi:MAG: PAS domain-containing sensor histidine kinase [Alphaproteobacteria bacterium]|nr:PAS domain-containing sensor histidine kinase [Alphaproteobacteria bacterium]